MAVIDSGNDGLDSLGSFEVDAQALLVPRDGDRWFWSPG